MAQAPQTPVKPVTIKFGQPAPADFEAKNFVGDSAASAVVLYDFGSTRFRLNGLRFKLESELPAAKYPKYQDFRRKINQADHAQVVLVANGA